MAHNDQVRSFWEQETCGTSPAIVQDAPKGSRAWFERIEEYRYRQEPYIHAIAQFTRQCGRRILEVGVGAGTDHLQFARAGALCHGVDLTDAAIRTTTAHLAAHGLASLLQRIDAERLPFDDAFFDLVYSWGVIHHAEHPERIVQEIHRVLKPGGRFVGMIYGRRSWLALKFWFRFALLRGRPWRSVADVLALHMESAGTKAYTIREARQLFAPFAHVSVESIVTCYDEARLPRWLLRAVPGTWGWFLVIRATK